MLPCVLESGIVHVGPAGALASEAPWASTMMILQSEVHFFKKALRACSPLRNSNLTFFALLVRKKIVYKSLSRFP